MGITPIIEFSKYINNSKLKFNKHLQLKIIHKYSLVTVVFNMIPHAFGQEHPQSISKVGEKYFVVNINGKKQLYFKYVTLKLYTLPYR